MEYYLQNTESVLGELNSSPGGLSEPRAAELLKENGPNRLADAKKKSLLKRFSEQILNPMIIVLIAAAVISGAMGEWMDTAVILFVVLLNSVLGVVQESKSEKAIEALQAMTASHSKVRRGGEVLTVDSRELVAGDIVLLEAGDSVPADLRILEAASLKTDEAALTGESVPVEKTSGAISAADGKVSLGDRTNMAYMGTTVSYGRGVGVVTATGMGTEMGRIADTLAHAQEGETPLQKKLDRLSRVLSIGVLAVCVFVFLFGLLRGHDYSAEAVLNTFLLAVSLAVAAIPEGLAAVVTIVLSIGVSNMSKRNAIIRKLTAVETLGCTEIVCTDKTGTLTQNRMTVTDTFGDPESLARAMALCSDAQISAAGGDVVGEPTECALVAHALKLGLDKNRLEAEYPRAGEAPFDSSRKMMTTLHALPGGGYVQFTKGAPDEVLKKCVSAQWEGRVVPLTDELREKFLGENRRMAGNALRVLSAACKPLDAFPAQISPEGLENGLTFLGLAGMIDPVRPEVAAAVKQCRDAGIRPVMITGDHRDTAAAIARELGIVRSAEEVVTGSELDGIPDEELEAKIEKFGVYARVQPEHKVRIVQAWKKKGKITAMTGDGVNDAPALKTADIGVGMGITGTDVTKNAADMVLADDNFATIVSAVEEGRRIYDNIRKAIQFLLSSNLSEVISIFLATMFGFVLFRPIHILWINLITDSLPAVALGMEKSEPGIMKRPARPRDEGLFSGGVGFDVIYQGLATALLTLGAYFAGSRDSHEIGMTMAFLTMSMCEIFHSWNMRSQRGSIFTLHTHNRVLLGAILLSVLLTAAMIYTPALAAVFSLRPLTAAQYFSAMGLAALIVPIVELVKACERSAR